MKYSELMQQWRLRCGLPAGRDECSLDYASGIDVDDLLHRRIADWYVSLVRKGVSGDLVDTDVSVGITVTMLPGNILSVRLPDEVLLPSRLTVEKQPCRIIDSELSPRLSRLVLEAGCSPTEGLEAVYSASGRELFVPYCRTVSSEDVMCRAYIHPPACPSPDYDFPVRMSALATIPSVL